MHSTSLETRTHAEHVGQLRQQRAELLAAIAAAEAQLPDAERDHAEYNALRLAAGQAWQAAEAALERARERGTLVGARGELLGYPGMAKTELRDAAYACHDDFVEANTRLQGPTVRLTTLRSRLSFLAGQLSLVDDQLAQAEARAATASRPDTWLSRMKALLPGASVQTQPAQPTARQARAQAVTPPERSAEENARLQRIRDDLGFAPEGG